jgi:hypothetical protein
MARSPSGRITRSRRAGISPNAAAASSSTPMTRPIAAIWLADRNFARAAGALDRDREPHLSPPNSRRRASLRALKVGQGAVIGFNAAKSHRIVDMRECHILRPELFALVEPLRELFARCCGRSAPPRCS